MSAHPNPDAPLSSAEHWCGPLCPTTNKATMEPLAGSISMVAGDNSTTGAVKASPPGGPNGPALTAPPRRTRTCVDRAPTRSSLTVPTSKKSAFDFVEDC